MANLGSFDFAKFYVSIIACFFICEDAQLLQSHVHMITWLPCNKFLSQLLDLALQFEILAFKCTYLILIISVLIDQIANLSLIFGHKQLLRLNLDPQLIFDSLWRPLIQNQRPKDLLILEVLLFIILQQVFFSIEVLLQSHYFLLVFFLHSFISLSLSCCYLWTYQQLAIEVIVLLFQLCNSFFGYVDQSVTIGHQFVNRLLIAKTAICKFLQFNLDLIYVYVFGFLLLELGAEASILTL